MKGKELGKLLLDGLMVAEDGRLFMYDCAHVDPECIHILVDDDPVLLGLILIRIKSGGEVCTLSFNVVELLTGPPPTMAVVVGVGWMTARPLPGYLQGSQT